MTPEPQADIKDAGECALVVELGASIDPLINDRVLALDAALQRASIPGVEETIPTYRSVTIIYDPLELPREDLIRQIRDLTSPGRARQGRRRIVFPACYAGQYATDLPEVAWSLSMTQEAVVRLHTSARYRVYMHGFAPGVAYLGGLPEELRLPRRMTPRPLVPAGCLLLAAGQATIASLDMPSGWHIVGRTPERVFVPERAPPFLIETGDEVGFECVDPDSFAALQQRADAGEVVARVGTAAG